MTQSGIQRRKLLQGAGSIIALPALESLGFRRYASASEKSPTPPPKRMICIGFGFGVTNETWFPSQKETGADYKLPKGLAPLAKLKKDFSVVQGCKNKFSRDAHSGSTFWLTGANRYAVAGQSFSNTISADQVAAAQLGANTRFSSIQLSSQDADGHGPGLSLAWDLRGKPVAGFNTPLSVYHKLFSVDNMPLAERQAMIDENRSVLDAVLTEAKRVQRGLTKTDVDKLDEYFQGIRDIEGRLTKDEQWLEVPKSKAPFPTPEANVSGKEEISLMYDLMVAALQTDNTRVVTYRQPIRALVNSFGLSVSPHNMSHYAPGQRREVSELRDKAQSELLANLLQKLKATKEADGSSLFDHVALAYGSNVRSIHHMDNCPTLLSGGGANLRLGENIVVKKDTPLCNVWLTMLQGLGIKVDRHGDSTGAMKELLA